MADLEKTKTRQPKKAAEKIRLQFEEIDETTVVARFPAISGDKPFELGISGLHWGMIRDIRTLQLEGTDMDALLLFFDKYIEGGAEAVPIRHTFTVFEAITEYLNVAILSTKKN